MAACVRPEEVYISVLVHFFVHPPPVELLPAPDRCTIARQLAVFLLKELKEPDSVVYPTLAQLCAKLRNKLGDLGYALVRCLEKTLLNLRSTHDVYKLFSILEKLLIRKTDVRAQAQGGRVVAGLDPLSPLGLFLRKQRLALQSMSFEAVAQLFTAIAEDLTIGMAPGGCFFTPTQASGSSGGGGAVPQDDGGGGTIRSGALRDRAALETYVSRLMQRIEQQGPSLPQAELDAALSSLERLSAGQSAVAGCGDERVPLARMLRLQAALQHRDYTAAQDLLHSFYNCLAPVPAGRNRNASGLLTLSQLHAEAWALSLFPRSLPGASCGVASALPRLTGDLALRITHKDTNGLGHTAEALQALNETMRLAQQCGDPVALLHSLSALCRLLAATAPGAPGLPPHNPAALRSSQAHHVQLLRMLRRCGERGRELGQPQLTAFAQLAAARFAMLHDVEPSDSGLHAPPGSLTAAVLASAAGAGPSALVTEVPAAGGAGGGELRSAPIMVSSALRDTLALATATSLSAAAPATPPPTVTEGTPPPPQRAAAAASDLYSAPLLFDRSLPLGAGAVIANAVQQLGGAAHLLQSAAWALHGHSTLELAHTMMYLAAFSDPRVGCGAPARFEDRSTACAQLVSAVARRGPAAARAAAAACLALLSADAGGTERASQSTSASTIATAGPAGEAVEIATAGCNGGGAVGEGCNGLALWGGVPLAAAWLCAEHDRALALGDSAAAMQLVGQLGALADPQTHRDVDLRLEAARRGVLNLMAAGSTSAAAQAATELFARCADAGLQAPALRCLLLLAEVHLTAGDPHGAFPHVLASLLPAQPGPGPSGGVFAAAAAAAAAEPGSLGAPVAGSAGAGAVGVGVGGSGRSHDVLAAQALVLLCRVWHDLSDGQQLEESLVLLQDALPLILAHGSVQLQARTQLTLAEIVMLEARSPADLTHCYSQLQRLLACAIQAAAAAEDFRLAALAACLLAWLHQGQGALSERDAAAELQEALLGRLARAEAACGAEGRTLDLGVVMSPTTGADGGGLGSGIGIGNPKFCEGVGLVA